MRSKPRKKPNNSRATSPTGGEFYVITMRVTAKSSLHSWIISKRLEWLIWRTGRSERNLLRYLQALTTSGKLSVKLDENVSVPDSPSPSPRGKRGRKSMH